MGGIVIATRGRVGDQVLTDYRTAFHHARCSLSLVRCGRIEAGYAVLRESDTVRRSKGYEQGHAHSGVTTKPFPKHKSQTEPALLLEALKSPQADILIVWWCVQVLDQASRRQRTPAGT
jgi:hypothetical protein